MCAVYEISTNNIHDQNTPVTPISIASESSASTILCRQYQIDPSISLLHHHCLYSTRGLCDGLVATTARRSAGKEVVDDQTADREEEDKQEPKDLVKRWLARLEDLDCTND